MKSNRSELAYRMNMAEFLSFPAFVVVFRGMESLYSKPTIVRFLRIQYDSETSKVDPNAQEVGGSEVLTELRILEGQHKRRDTDRVSSSLGILQDKS